MRRNLLGGVYLFVLAVSLAFFGEKPANAATIIWTNVLGGDWSNPENWTPNIIPGSGDDALITLTGTYNVTMNTDVTVDHLMVGGDSGTQTLTWTSGTLNTRLAIKTNGNLTVNGGSQKNFMGGAITNNGTIDWEEINGLNCPGPCTLDNSGLFVLHTSLNCIGSGEFNNIGTLLVPAGVTANFFQTWFFSSAGVIDVETNASLQISSGYPGAIDFANGSQITGAGLTRMASGDLTASGTITVNGTFELAAGAKMRGNQTWTGPGNFNWTGGTMDQDSITTIAPDFHLTILPAAQNSYLSLDDSHTLDNRGTVIWNGGPVSSGGVNPGTFNNNGLFILQTNCDFGSYFNNNGTILVPAGRSFYFFEDWQFTNYGIIDVETNGSLGIASGYVGPITLADGSQINGAGVTRLPFGDVTASGTITVNGTIELTGSGSLHGTQTWTGPGNFNWTGGTMDQPGTTTIAPDIHFTIFPAAQNSYLSLDDGHTLDNRGTVSWNGGPVSSSGVNPGTFNNYGLFILQTNCDFGSYFNNNGTILVPAGRSCYFFEDWQFTNYGIIDVETNGSLGIASGYVGPITLADGSQINGDGVTRLNFGDVTASGTITVNGTIELTGSGSLHGTQTWTGPGNFNWTGGTMDQSGTTTIAPDIHFNIAGADDIFLNNHTLNNQGTATWTATSLFQSTNGTINNAGLFLIQRPCNFNSDGTSIFNNLAGGTLCVRGTNIPPTGYAGSINWLFNNAGTLDIQNGIFALSNPYAPAQSSSHRLIVGGAAPGTSLGQLSLNSFSPNGTLSVTLTNGLVITNGSSFTLMTYGTRTGAFSNTQLPALPPSLTWHLNYGPASLNLEAVSTPQIGSAKMLPDGTFQLSFGGPYSGNYLIEVSSNLHDWVPVQTNSAVGGPINFIDTTATNSLQRFYRVSFGN